MGYIDIFFNKGTNNSSSLNNLREEVKKQNKWIQKIHSFSSDLHRYTKDIEKSNSKHKHEVIEHINMLSKWVDYLNTSHNDMKLDINDLKKDIRKELRSDFEKYHEVLLTYVNLKIHDEKKERDEIKHEILDEIRQEFLRRDNDKLKQNKSYENTFERNYTKTNNSITNTDIITNYELTNPEKELLNLLFNEDTPMTYDDMSRRLNKSVSSVRVYLNSLKSKRNMIEEFKKPNGIKIFSIKNSEMVKTLFNIV